MACPRRAARVLLRAPGVLLLVLGDPVTISAWHISAVVLLLAVGVGCDERSVAHAAPVARAADADELPAPTKTAAFEPPAAAPRAELEPLEMDAVKLQKGAYNSARACGACHESIFRRWSRSMHANSFLDPVFKSALLKAHYESQGKAAAQCLRCHSPTVTATGDIYGTTALTKEGVTCDYCHSIGELVTDGGFDIRYQVDWKAKHGPYSAAKSPAHDTEYRPYFERSEVCAGCHDYTLPDGTIVFATYSEWKASKYAEEGKQCLDCHMPRLRGSTVVKTAANGKGHDSFNDHELVGGHEPSQVKRAMTVTVESLTRDADRVRAVVVLENSGAGHYVPTGIPSRKLVLTVSATQRQRTVFQRQMTYQRVMQAEDNRTLGEDWEIKLLSRRVLRDNRIAPGELRREVFVFNAAQTDDVALNVQLSYVYDPGSATDYTPRLDVSLADFEKVLPRGM